MRHFLDLSDAGGDAIAAMIHDAQDRKAARLGWAKGRPDALSCSDCNACGLLVPGGPVATAMSICRAGERLQS